VLMVGAQAWACRMAQALSELGFRVLFMDTNRANLAAARMAGIPTHVGSALTENLADSVDLGGIGRLLALTPNDEMNALATQQFGRVFGRANVYQLASTTEKGQSNAQEKHLHGRWLFAPSASYMTFDELADKGWIVKVSKVTDAFDYAAFRDLYGSDALVLFIVDQQNRLGIMTADGTVAPVPGQTLISLVPAHPDGTPAARDGAVETR